MSPYQSSVDRQLVCTPMMRISIRNEKNENSSPQMDAKALGELLVKWADGEIS